MERPAAPSKRKFSRLPAFVPGSLPPVYSTDSGLAGLRSCMNEFLIIKYICVSVCIFYLFYFSGECLMRQTHKQKQDSMSCFRAAMNSTYENKTVSYVTDGSIFHFHKEEK